MYTSAVLVGYRRWLCLFAYTRSVHRASCVPIPVLVALFSLWSGILADEMGLGKTLQSISILAYMRDFQKVSWTCAPGFHPFYLCTTRTTRVGVPICRGASAIGVSCFPCVAADWSIWFGRILLQPRDPCAWRRLLRLMWQVYGPHIILLPKSVLGNWKLEFKRFCPSVRVLLLSGSKVRSQQPVCTPCPWKVFCSSRFVFAHHPVCHDDGPHELKKRVAFGFACDVCRTSALP